MQTIWEPSQPVASGLALTLVRRPRSTAPRLSPLPSNVVTALRRWQLSTLPNRWHRGSLVISKTKQKLEIQCSVGQISQLVAAGAVFALRYCSLAELLFAV